MTSTFTIEHYPEISLIASLLILCGMLIFMELGRNLALNRDDLKNSPGAGAIDGAVFSLMGLLLAFSFYGAYDRIVSRNMAAIDESDALGTAYMRLDVLPGPESARLKGLMREYTLSRIDEYHRINSVKGLAEARENTERLKDRIWSGAVESCRKAPYPFAAQLVLPLLNETFDSADRRNFMRLIHPPKIIYVLLFCSAMASALLAGFRMADRRRRSWVHRLIFISVTAITVFVTLNLEYPLLGLVHSETLLLPLKETLSSMSR